ncbi:LOW QUALITY PROTEIN: piRNA biogenesis protein EXD1 [Aegotheles albertisi]
MPRSSQPVGAPLGRTVKVTLNRGVFQGVLQHLDPDRSLPLVSVKDLATGRSTPGVRMFFDHEIVNVKLLDELDSGKETAMRSECTSAVEGNKRTDIGPADCDPWSSPCISLESQLRASNSLKYSLSVKKEEDNVEYTVVDSFQQKFGPAVKATKRHVFLFDIFLLGPQAFKNGLQMVLEDKNILKVMHDCCWISDCLFHRGVLLFNVFDTQVADALQFSTARGGFLPHRVCMLQECLMRHLKIPSKWDAIMKGRQQMASENPDIWFFRPFPASLIKVLALKAIYLLLLHSSLMDISMPELTAVVDDYLNTSRTGSGDHLESMKKLQREKANYRMNKDGLLIRPVMELKRGTIQGKPENQNQVVNQ